MTKTNAGLVSAGLSTYLFNAMANLVPKTKHITSSPKLYSFIVLPRWIHFVSKRVTFRADDGIFQTKFERFVGGIVF